MYFFPFWPIILFRGLFPSGQIYPFRDCYTCKRKSFRLLIKSFINFLINLKTRTKNEKQQSLTKFFGLHLLRAECFLSLMPPRKAALVWKSSAVVFISQAMVTKNDAIHPAYLTAGDWITLELNPLPWACLTKTRRVIIQLNNFSLFSNKVKKFL